MSNANLGFGYYHYFLTHSRAPRKPSRWDRFLARMFCVDLGYEQSMAEFSNWKSLAEMKRDEAIRLGLYGPGDGSEEYFREREASPEKAHV